MDSKPGRPPVPSRAEVDRRVLVYSITSLLAVAGAVGGLSMFVLSQEPDSTYISGKPWLAFLTTTRYGVEFITYGGDYTTVLYGIIDEDGNWVSWPTPIVPRLNIRVFPWDSVLVSGLAGRVHIAWTLVDSVRSTQTFHYVQLDIDGRVRSNVGPLGDAVLNFTSFAELVSPGLLVTDSDVQVFWEEGASYWRIVLDLNGQVTSPPSLVSSADPAAYPSRAEFEGRTLRDSLASVERDARGTTYYVWQRSVYRGFTVNLFQEYDLVWRRSGSGGVVEKPIYSTWGWWWTTKAAVLPAFVLLVAGLVAAPILSVLRHDWIAVRAGGKLKRRFWAPQNR